MATIGSNFFHSHCLFLCVQCCSKTEKYFLRIESIEINRIRQKRTRLVFFQLNIHVWKCRPTWEQCTCAPGLELYCDLGLTLGIILQALAPVVMVQPFALRREGSETIHWMMSEWNVASWICIYSFTLIFLLMQSPSLAWYFTKCHFLLRGSPAAVTESHLCYR